jgi:hypothetical protein
MALPATRRAGHTLATCREEPMAKTKPAAKPKPPKQDGDWR